ncbi:carbonic anhydrase, partial [Streptomyces sp. SID7499]|nr:carbonic anhydrase [Streptomyces sp. SID7499]
MQSLVEHARTFTEHVAANAKHFERLADGQTPEA